MTSNREGDMLATVVQCKSCGRTHTLTFTRTSAWEHVVVVGFRGRYTHKSTCPNTNETLVWGNGLGVWPGREVR